MDHLLGPAANLANALRRETRWCRLISFIDVVFILGLVGNPKWVNKRLKRVRLFKTSRVCLNWCETRVSLGQGMAHSIFISQELTQSVSSSNR